MINEPLDEEYQKLMEKFVMDILKMNDVEFKMDIQNGEKGIVLDEDDENLLFSLSCVMSCCSTAIEMAFDFSDTHNDKDTLKFFQKTMLQNLITSLHDMCLDYQDSHGEKP